MAIYTSYYARKGGDPNAIAISATPPKYYTGKCMPELAPTWDFLGPYKEGLITKEEYTEKYVKILESYVDVDWYKWLAALPDPTYFLCFEKPNDFCHRHIFADWVEQKCGWVIPEWKTPDEIETQRQLDVVDNLLEF